MACMLAMALTLDLASHAVSDAPSAAGAVPSFDALYAAEFSFVWRNLRRLGVPQSSLRDAAQDVFLVVLRRLSDFEGRAPLQSWLYSIVVRVARQYRRSHRRKDLGATDDVDQVAESRQPSPQGYAERNEALRLLLELLDQLDADKREAFVLSDLEEMSAPEIALALDVNLNTVYSRVRAARLELRAALTARAARERGEP